MADLYHRYPGKPAGCGNIKKQTGAILKNRSRLPSFSAVAWAVLLPVFRGTLPHRPPEGPGKVQRILKSHGGRHGADGQRAVAQQLGGDYRVRTRYELRASFYRIMTYEKWGIFFISLLVLVVASFSVVGSLAMLIVEKRRDIGTLRALGADTTLVRSIFRSEGLLICALGAALGVVLGVGATLLQQHFGLIEIPAETFLTKSYPVEFRPGDLAAVLAAFGAVACVISNITVCSMIKTNVKL